MSVLQHKKALVVGITGGIGNQIALLLQNEGGSVYGIARDESKLDPALHLKSFTAIDFANECSEAAVLSAARRIDAEAEGIDILVNSAGVFDIKPFCATTEGDYRRALNVNVKPAFFVTQAVIPGMAERRWGRVVNIGSSSCYGGAKNTVLYCLSKHAILGFSRALFEEYRESGVRVFCISPGSTQTEMARVSTDQDVSTFLEPSEVAAWVVEAIKSDTNLITQELRLNRLIMR